MNEKGAIKSTLFFKFNRMANNTVNAQKAKRKIVYIKDEAIAPYHIKVTRNRIIVVQICVAEKTKKPYERQFNTHTTLSTAFKAIVQLKLSLNENDMSIKDIEKIIESVVALEQKLDAI